MGKGSGCFTAVPARGGGGAGWETDHRLEYSSSLMTDKSKILPSLVLPMSSVKILLIKDNIYVSSLKVKCSTLLLYGSCVSIKANESK